MTECGVFAAMICIFSPLTFPVGPVPISLGIFAVMLAGMLLSTKQAVITVIIYEFIGICGLPVFAGARAGVGVLAGPTGGFLWSYIISVSVISVISGNGRRPNFYLSFAACILGTVLCYIFGTLQFVAISDGISMSDALKYCVYPFVVFDVIKAICASSLANSVKKRMR